MRALAVIAVLLGACGSEDRCDTQICEPFDAPIDRQEFGGTWQVRRTPEAQVCLLKGAEAPADVEVRIEGDRVAGYTGADAAGGTAGAPGTMVESGGRITLTLGFEESWPAANGWPAVTPTMTYALYRREYELYGTAHAEAAYTVEGERVDCSFDFSLRATRVSGS